MRPAGMEGGGSARPDGSKEGRRVTQGWAEQIAASTLWTIPGSAALILAISSFMKTLYAEGSREPFSFFTFSFASPPLLRIFDQCCCTDDGVRFVFRPLAILSQSFFGDLATSPLRISSSSVVQRGVDTPARLRPGEDDGREGVEAMKEKGIPRERFGRGGKGWGRGEEHVTTDVTDVNRRGGSG